LRDGEIESVGGEGCGGEFETDLGEEGVEGCKGCEFSAIVVVVVEESGAEVIVEGRF